MKKILLLAALFLGFGAANAQVTVEGSKFSDNWSLTLKGGVVSPFSAEKSVDSHGMAQHPTFVFKCKSQFCGF